MPRKRTDEVVTYPRRVEPGVVEVEPGVFDARVSVGGRGRRVEPQERFRGPRALTRARAWRTEQRAAADAGTFVDPRRGDVTFRDYAARWLAARDVREQTARTYRIDLDRALAWDPPRTEGRGLAETPLREFLHLDAERLRRHLRATYGAHSARNTEGRVRSVFRAAVHEGVLPGGSPFDGHRLAGMPTARNATPPPTRAQVDDLVAAATLPGDRALILLAAGSGLRLSELLGLDVDALDLDAGTVRVDRQLVYLPGGRGHLIGEPKSAAGYRTVPLAGWVVDAAREHLRTAPAPVVTLPTLLPNRRGQVVEGVTDTRLAFTTRNARPVKRNTFDGRWQTIARRAGLDPIPRFHHATRALFASILLDGGVPATTVEELLGHEAQGVLARHYAVRLDGWDERVRAASASWWSERRGSGAGSVRNLRAV